MEHYKAEQAMRLIERHQVNTMWGFDTHFLAIRRHELYGMFDLSSLEKTWVGSQPGSFDEIKSLGVSWQGNIYANSECAACGTFYPYRLREDEFHMKHSHGLPVPGSEIVIVDPETHEHLGPNEKGEICIRGPQLFLGYYNLPEETAKAFMEEGLHRTGDYGWVDEDGFVYYSGRYKEMLKSGGENVSVAEVEQTLVLETPWVSQAMVVGLPDPKWGEKIVALIQLRADVDVSPEQLRLRCKEVMAGYKVPKEFVFVTEDQWVVTPTGKFDRKALRRFAAACLGQPLGESRQEEIPQ
jgi:fatty-acyl-CoA synthase